MQKLNDFQILFINCKRVFVFRRPFRINQYIDVISVIYAQFNHLQYQSVQEFDNKYWKMKHANDNEIAYCKKRRIIATSKAIYYDSETPKGVKQFTKEEFPQIEIKKKPLPLRLPSVLPKNSLSNISNISKQISPSKICHPNYYIGELIGEGAFAKVRKAIRKSDNYECAIKIYQKFRINTEARKKALKNEVQILNSIKHKSIISLIDFYETSQTYNLVMQHFSNCSLAAYAKKKRPLENQEIKQITKSIAQALVYLHEKGIAHRDIKPQNILIQTKQSQLEHSKLSKLKNNANYSHDQDLIRHSLSSRGFSLKIIDFGLSMTGEQNEVKIVGTPQYMAPELLKHYSSGNKYSNQQPSYDPYKADTWALGILLYWIALGYYPPSLNGKRSVKKIQLLFPVDIHPGFEYLLTKMLREDPNERIRINQVLQDSWLRPIDLKAEIMRLSKRKSSLQAKHSIDCSTDKETQ